MKELTWVILFFLLTSCSNEFKSQSTSIVTSLSDDLGCFQAKDIIWKTFYLFEENKTPLITQSNKLQETLKSKLSHSFPKWAEKYPENVNTFLTNYLNLYSLISNRKKNINYKSWKKILSQIELGNPMSGLNKLELTNINSLINKASKALQSIDSKCEGNTPPDTEEPPTGSLSFIDFLKLENTPLEYGAKKSLLTAYQDCKLEELPALNSNDHNIEGIKIIGKHPNGVGKLRVIDDLELFFKSHHYLGKLDDSIIRNPASANNNESSLCLEQKKFPLIYDYGGKPKASSQIDSKLNFFINSGSGSDELGIDCSGFVFSALATAGLKIHPDKTLKAVNVYSLNSEAFRRPTDHNLLCLDYANITPKKSLRNGDIIAINGHVLITVNAQEDPLGIKKAMADGDCSKISHSDFKFEVMQSSPSKGGIGINRMEASDYFGTTSTMRKGLVDIAQSACKNITQGLDAKLYNSKLSVVRHKGTPECLSQEIPLVAESCLKTCDTNSIK